MLKIRKKKQLIQNVVRAEDLRKKDLIQYDSYSRARVQRIMSLDSTEMRIEVERIPLSGRHGDIETMTLHRDLKVFVWQ